MQILNGWKDAVGGRVVLCVPRWLDEATSPSGLPYRVVPVLSSLLHNGFAVDLVTGLHDDLVGEAVRERLRGADAAVVWCAELNPGLQLRDLVTFLETAREAAPSMPRLAGGGFFPLVPEGGLDLGPLVETTVTSQEVSALSDALLGREPVRESFDLRALHELDLRPFLRPESMLFGNDAPSLQVPTGLGCSKRCRFCFYEQTNWRAASAADVVDAIAQVHRHYGVRQFLMGELDFLASRSRALDIAQRLVDEGLDVRWFALCTVDDLQRLGDDELDLLVRSGLQTLELGIEAGTDRALQALGKRFSVDDARTAHRRLVASGVMPVYNFVFGWPGERPRDRRAARRLIDELHRSADRVRFNFRLYQPIPGTTMGEEALRLLPSLPKDLQELSSFRVDAGMPWLGRREERRVRFLVEYVLPLAFDDALYDARRPGLRRRLLQQVARWRSRSGLMSLRFDRRLFERTAATSLPVTYLP